MEYLAQTSLLPREAVQWQIHSVAVPPSFLWYVKKERESRGPFVPVVFIAFSGGEAAEILLFFLGLGREYPVMSKHVMP